MIKNEIDIIETFVRYHLSFLDGMVILDNGSTDGTIEVLLKLIDEGLLIHLTFNDNPAYNQSELTTELFYNTLKKFSPEYIVPLDADEFLTTNSDKEIEEIIQNDIQDDAINYISWVTYVPTEKDDQTEKNILKKLRYRRQEQHNYDEKIIIPTSLAKKYKIKIKQGNHDLYKIENVSFKKNILSSLDLAHFPIRSINQMKSKYLIGWLANLARPEQVLFDWYYYYNIIKSGKDFSINDLKEMALYYDIPDKNIKIETVEDPIDLSLVNKIDLKYTPTENDNLLNNILNYTETLAHRYSNMVKKNNFDESNLPSNDNDILQTIHDYLLIEGWLSIKEACELYRTVKSIEGDNLIICEIGSWLGKSSYVLAKAIEHKKDSCLYCIDPFDASGDTSSEFIYKKGEGTSKKTLLERFKINMERLNVSKLIHILKGDSFNIVKKFNKEIDFLFIDGNHNHESVLQDYKDWSPLIKKGGYIAFHDVGAAHTTGPKQVVELEIANNPMWGEQRMVDELYVAKKIK